MTIPHRPFLVEFLGTPEAGKTTTIKLLRNSLVSLGYNVDIIRESAEIVPSYFGKGSLDAHFWMRLTTARSILEALQGNADIVLLDRGTLDTIFWDYLFFKEHRLDESTRKHVDDFFTDIGLFPNLCIILHIPPELSIQRRGGEGRIVTKKFVEEFNDTLFEFASQIDQPQISIDTSSKPPDEIAQTLLKEILAAINA